MTANKYNSPRDFEYKICINCRNESQFHEMLVTKTSNLRVVICKKCGLVFLNPAPNEKAYLRYYKMHTRSPRKGESIMPKGKLKRKRYLSELLLQFIPH